MMTRNQRLANITEQVKRDWIPDMIEAYIVDKDVWEAKVDNHLADLELLQRGLL
jgi:hypothetical protein